MNYGSYIYPSAFTFFVYTVHIEIPGVGSILSRYTERVNVILDECQISSSFIDLVQRYTHDAENSAIYLDYHGVTSLVQIHLE